MVSAGMPAPKEGEPGWVPYLEDCGKEGLKRRIIVLETDENGHEGWDIDKRLPWFPKRLGAAIEWLHNIEQSVPAEYRDRLEIEVKAEDMGSYEDWWKAQLTISYLRDPTPDELQRWNNARENELKFEVNRDLKEFNRLKKKLGVD